MASDGSLALGLSLRIAASFQRLISPEKDPRQGRAVEREIAGLDAFDIDHRHHARHDGRKLDETVRLQVARAERHVGRAEGDLLALDLADAVGGADRAIVHRDAGLFLVGLDPLRIDRIGEARAGAGHLGGGDRRRRGRSDEARRRQGAEELQCPLLPMSIPLAERRTRSTDSDLPGVGCDAFRTVRLSGLKSRTALGVLPLPTKPGLARVSRLSAQVGQARLAVGRGWGEGVTGLP